MISNNVKCILVDPPIIAVNISKKKGIKEATEELAIYPPIGLAYIAAVLRENGVDVKILDAKSLNISHKEVFEIIKKENPDFVGITVFTSNLKSVLDMCKGIKELCPSTKIVLGGPHIHPEHSEIIKNDFVDFCVRGEGEITMPELINAVFNGGDLREVKGITFKDGGKVVVNPDRPFIQDLDTLPFPARDLLPMHIYKAFVEGNFTVMTASRGCPFGCHFCSVPQFWHIHRRRSVGNVLDELEHICEKYKVGFVRFTDEIFLLNKKWVIELCERIVERGLNERMKWSCDGRVDIVSEELLEAMKKANCSSIAYGIEFGNQRILDLSGKKTKVTQIYNAIDMTNKAGISAHGLFMIGYPTETKETIEDTINLAKSLNLHSADFSVVAPFPGTQLYEYCKKNNLLRTENWEEFNYSHPEKGIIKLENVTDEELIELNHKAHREFYFRHVSGRIKQELHDLFFDFRGK